MELWRGRGARGPGVSCGTASPSTGQVLGTVRPNPGCEERKRPINLLAAAAALSGGTVGCDFFRLVVTDLSSR